MINAILIPTDFSEVANNAIQYAVELAKKCNAHIHIFHAKQIPIADPAFPAEAYQLYVDEIARTEKEGFEHLKNGILNNVGLTVSFHSSTGFVADEILDYASNNNIDLVIMGTKGATGMAEVFIGTNAASVIDKAHLPVLVIPPGFKYKNIEHIIYATDYNEPEFPSVSRMMFFAELYDARVTVLHAKTEVDHYFNAEGNFFNRNLENFSHKKIAVINLNNKDASSAIEDWVDTQHADFLVLAKHNRNFFDRLFHRSLSKQMAYHSKVPLLVLNK